MHQDHERQTTFRARVLMHSMYYGLLRVGGARLVFENGCTAKGRKFFL